MTGLLPGDRRGTGRIWSLSLRLAGATESLTGKGRLRTYLGIAPGVGKTYVMLRDGRAQRRCGVDALVAYRERQVGRRPLLSSPI